MVFILPVSLGLARGHLHFYVPRFQMVICRFIAGMGDWLGIPVQENKTQDLVFPPPGHTAFVRLGHPSPEPGTKLAGCPGFGNPVKKPQNKGVGPACGFQPVQQNAGGRVAGGRQEERYFIICRFA